MSYLNRKLLYTSTFHSMRIYSKYSVFSYLISFSMSRSAFFLYIWGHRRTHFFIFILKSLTSITKKVDTFTAKVDSFTEKVDSFSRKVDDFTEKVDIIIGVTGVKKWRSTKLLIFSNLKTFNETRVSAILRKRSGTKDLSRVAPMKNIYLASLAPRWQVRREDIKPIKTPLFCAIFSKKTTKKADFLPQKTRIFHTKQPFFQRK